MKLIISVEQCFLFDLGEPEQPFPEIGSSDIAEPTPGDIFQQKCRVVQKTAKTVERNVEVTSQTGRNNLRERAPKQAKNQNAREKAST